MLLVCIDVQPISQYCLRECTRLYVYDQTRKQKETLSTRLSLLLQVDMCTKLHKATQPTLQRGRRRRAALSVGLIPGLTWRRLWLWLWLQSLCRDHVSSHSALPPPSASATERSSKRIYHHCRLPNFSSISDPPFSLTPPPQPFAPFDYDKPSIAPAADHESPSVHDDAHLTGTASATITTPPREIYHIPQSWRTNTSASS